MILPSVGEDVLFSTGQSQFGVEPTALLTGPMSLRLMSSRTFSIADFEGSTGGGLMRVELGIVGGGVAL